ncbi:hypothetical protein AB0K40_39970 [Nonomuraea bangladeshensis]|uniref:Uncharacterized protein n=1 Tax=Nonomuraea bangladeshensis TaxID=404385 RepID=A0ABV3HGQ3_9ACTN
MSASPGQNANVDRGHRMARFAAGARRLVVRAASIGVLVAAGWLLAVLFGMLTAAPAAADSAAATGAAATGTSAVAEAEAGSTQFPALVGSGGFAASDNAEAMAGRTVAGLNSQQDPGLPSPSTAGSILDGTNGLVPNGGGSGPYGPVAWDVARSPLDPRLQARRVPIAYVLPPVVRTAADDPSFSPD